MNTAQPDIYSKKPWLKFYDEGVPPTITYPSMTYPEFIREAFEKFPNRVALYYFGKTLNYGELDILSNKFASFLLEKGCNEGDVAGVHLPNIPASYISALAQVCQIPSPCQIAGIGIELFDLFKLNWKQRLILGWELRHSAITH